MKRWLLNILFILPFVLMAKPVKSGNYKVASDIWDTIAKNHFDKNFNQKYRKKVFDKYRKEIIASKTDAELATVLNKIIAEVGQSHMRVAPPIGSAASLASKAAVSELPPPPGTPRVPAGIGVEVCRTDKTISILRVRPDFPAARAGIYPGDIIKRINNLKIAPEQTSTIPWSLLTERLLWGLPGTTVKLELARPGRKPHIKNYSLIRRANGGEWFKLGIMPRFASLYESRLLHGNIGYIRFSVFTPKMIWRVRYDIMNKLKNAKAIVIDLRNNPGGLILMPKALAGWLSKKVVGFGKMINGKTVLTFKSYPQSVAFSGPLAILINGGSGSAAEICAAGFQDSKAAKLFGTRTSGLCLASQYVKLDSGFRLQTVFGDLIRVNGKRIEHIGVTPDVIVHQKETNLLKGRDAVLDAAVEYLKKAKKP